MQLLNMFTKGSARYAAKILNNFDGTSPCWLDRFVFSLASFLQTCASVKTGISFSVKLGIYMSLVWRGLYEFGMFANSFAIRSHCC